MVELIWILGLRSSNGDVPKRELSNCAVKKLATQSIALIFSLAINTHKLNKYSKISF